MWLSRRGLLAERIIGSGFLACLLGGSRSLVLLNDVLNHVETGLDHVAQHVKIDVAEFLDVQARFAGLVFAEFLEERLKAIEARREIETEIALARREADKA